jgi:hypothetical protein
MNADELVTLSALVTSGHPLAAFALENHQAAKTMERMGGGFASALALAYFRADSDNQARILGAFPDLFERYRRIARELAETTET